jgi:hypothetical protein
MSISMQGVRFGRVHGGRQAAMVAPLAAPQLRQHKACADSHNEQQHGKIDH